ncbi:hypothetical protein FisN_18Lh115 [Fistulifera solaris]|uniref:Uncharacterized protein n=1 Tax=Fistulifera solaris TaxID=1519565 RepID=A0A1Z5KFD2_FISSO|nr:hypothetical protein FisN_18Lh115 [Fistulifera solaris]|eukprot:GAX24802.1 hypothetical protein FisN_18Lh115 [Fistulifera solaris]
MDAVVQFIRNGLCCIKDLGLLKDTFLYDPSITAQYYKFPEPLNKTTPLEVFIAITQFYAFWFTAKGGLNLMFTSSGKIKRIERLMESRPPVKTDADRLINASLVKEGMHAIRSMFVGLLLFFLGSAFFWLFANSFHVTEAGWIGGVAGLIHALTVAEIALVPLLYYMYKDGFEHLAKATRLEHLAETLRANALKRGADIGLSSIEQIAKWAPFWGAGVSPYASAASNEAKLVAQETDYINDTIRKLTEKPKADDKMAKAKKQEYLSEQSEELYRTARVTRMEGYREFLYLVINSIAFYGYLMAIFAFHFPDEAKQPMWLRQAMGNHSNTDADWYGNFAGDLMWTIEPVIILTSPIFLNRLRSTSTASTAKKKKVE